MARAHDQAAQQGELRQQPTSAALRLGPHESDHLVAEALKEAEARQSALINELAALRHERALDGAVDDEHDPEGETTSSIWSKLQGRLGDIERDIEALQLAQQRIADGTYGICVTCGKPIARGRLRRRPAATQCIDCVRRSRPAW